MLFTSYLANKLMDWFVRSQAFTPPGAGLSVGLLVSTHGPRNNSATYALNNTFSVKASDGKTHLYKCTTPGSTAAAQGTLYPGAEGEVITDGTAVFTEQTAAVRGSLATEASYSGYARANTPASLANWAGTQGAGSTTVSSGTGVPRTSNNGVITIGTAPAGPTAYVWATAHFDAVSGGNMLMVHPLTDVKTINAGDPAPSFPAATLSFTLDS
ncbi:hypothetical protein [Rhodoferax sp. BLA1]|uniref:phage tail fiber protein n=1 Tax=Rhodoferax sp. BLA1 TaxID=2576062 RepID=UPI0015D10A24|nr:hypothetical protein [Rhodoferax sp. BLA1]